MGIVINRELYIRFFPYTHCQSDFNVFFFLFSVEVSCVGLHVVQREMEGFGDHFLCQHVICPQDSERE